jgi:mRNA-degrading endonuclease toxin of MazEF toxin-antitoxin module
LIDQIQSVDKARLVKKLGSLPASTQQKMLATLEEIFAE